MSELVTAVGGASSSGFQGLALEELPSGAPLYINRVSGKIGLAAALSEATATVVGLARTAIPADTVGVFDDDRHQENDWTAITGTPNLAVGQVYFLDLAAPGRLTNVAPGDVDVGKFSAAVGVAVTTKIMELNIQPPIGL